jgi:hypothetical protein
MKEYHQVVIKQTTMTLPFLNDEVPVLCLADGRLYIPVYVVCHTLGIRAEVYIQRWRRLVLWINARKLPLQTKKHGKRLVWCLPILEVPYLYGLFNWQRVSPERRLQLCQATEEQAKRSNMVYEQMQQEYKAMRQALFTFLINFADIDTLLKQYVEILSPSLDNASALLLSNFIENGRSLFQKATVHARKMLHDQETLPIIDTFTIEADRIVIDAFSMPLLPIVPPEDKDLFILHIRQLVDWRRELQVFLSKRG